jgi:DNA-binding GntR family transcriptional regulator
METISMRLYRILADEIINGTLAPGDSLEENAIGERFKVSRTPIRAALRELASNGLIELRPRKGGVVVSISIDELADTLEAMGELEALCCRISAERMSAVQKTTGTDPPAKPGVHRAGRRRRLPGDECQVPSIDLRRRP